jgi:sugar lactone lactonase YvrE
MLRLIILGFLVTIFWSISAQSLSSPESVAYDPGSGLIWVSNPGSRSISVIRSPGDTALFAANLYIPLGLRFHAGLLWCADSACLRAFNLDGSEQHHIEVPGARQLNGLCPAPDGGLFVSDRRGHSILHVSLPDLSIDTLLHDIIRIPNGLSMLDSNHLLVVNSTDSASIFIVSLPNARIEKEIPSKRAYLDGITRYRGNTFVISSWGENWKNPALLCFDPYTDTAPRVIFEDNGSCADIHYFPELGMLFVPGYYENKLSMIPVEDIFKACQSSD